MKSKSELRNTIYLVLSSNLDADKVKKTEAELYEKILSLLSDEKSGEIATLTWKLFYGTLTVGGTGEMPDFSADDRPPWYIYRDLINKVVIKDGVTNIGACAFGSKRKLVNPNSQSYPNLRFTCIESTVMEDIGDDSFCRSLLESVIIPDSVTGIGKEAFFKGVFKTLIIPDSVESIGEYAFAHCEDLEELTIGASVKRIGERAFYSCKRLAGVSIKNLNPPAVIASTFEGFLTGKKNLIVKDTLLTVPKGRKEAYQNAAGWKDFGNIVETA
jgi:hypothetical protein